MTTSDLPALIHALYAAPGTVDGWNTFLDRLRSTVHGSSANLISHDLQSQMGDVFATAGSDPEGMRLYQQHWASFDHWAYSPRHSRLEQGAVTVGDELIEHTRIVAGVLESGPAATSVVAVAGGEQRPFGAAEVEFLGVLVPHVRRALQLHRRLIDAASSVAGLESVIDHASRAVMLADSQRRVTFMNRAASRLAAMRDGLTIDHGELRAARAADTTRLRALVTDAIRTSNGARVGAGGALTLGRPSGRRSLVVLVCPISRQRPFLASIESAAAMILVSDPEQTAVPDEEVLKTLFGLTSAEARLTHLLAHGASLMEAAARLGLRRETVRSRVKTILQKTGTHRQAELVRLVLNGTPHI